MTAAEKILSLFEENKEWTPKEIIFQTGVSQQMIHRVLTKLTQEAVLEKFGKPPKVFYRKKTEVRKREKTNLTKKKISFLKKEFLLITETGEYLEGAEGFELWCAKRELPLEKTTGEFIKTKEKHQAYYNEKGFVDGMEKLKNTKGFSKIHLDRLYYLDFYAIERFGKTKLGTLLHFAKQGQNKFLMRKMMESISGEIESFISRKEADAIGFVPPTIKRETQLMDFIKKSLKLDVALVDIQKISGIIPVPQKSLNKLDERINNANTSFAVFGNKSFETAILLDDAVGSGATMNQIAGKIKDKGIAKKVIGLAVVGSFKGFDVIAGI